MFLPKRMGNKSLLSLLWLGHLLKNAVLYFQREVHSFLSMEELRVKYAGKFRSLLVYCNSYTGRRNNRYAIGKEWSAAR